MQNSKTALCYFLAFGLFATFCFWGGVVGVNFLRQSAPLDKGLLISVIVLIISAIVVTLFSTCIPLYLLLKILFEEREEYRIYRFCKKHLLVCFGKKQIIVGQ